VTLGTGIGGGLVVNGRPLIGKDGTAGEIGHITVDIDGPLCGDGMPGHAEAIGSGTAIAREGRALLDRGEAPGLAALAQDAPVDAALVAKAADEGDEACQRVLERAWTAVGALCAGLVIALNPEVIVLGGSIALHRPELRTAAEPLGSGGTSDAGKAAYGVLLEAVRACLATGEVAGDAETLALSAWCVVHGLATLLLDGPLRDHLDLVTTFDEFNKVVDLDAHYQLEARYRTGGSTGG